MGTNKNEIRIRVQCTADENHGKILRFAPDSDMMFLEALAALIDGSHKAYIYPPGKGSPIGHCAVCGASLETEIQRIDSAPDIGAALKASLEEDAEHRKPVN